MGKVVEFKAVGLTFVPAYPQNLLTLHDRIERMRAEAIMGDGDPEPVIAVDLVRNPDNPYDTNAVEIHIPMIGRRSMVGHVPRDLAARLAPSLDGGDEWDARLDAVLIDPHHPRKPGVAVRLEKLS